MRKGHRRFHHLFWYIVTPILLAFLYTSLITQSETQPSNDQVPAAAAAALLP